MNLYLKHSRKYVALLRKAYKLTLQWTSYYAWEYSLSGTGLTLEVMYEGTNKPSRFLLYKGHNTFLVETNSFRELLTLIDQHSLVTA